MSLRPRPFEINTILLAALLLAGCRPRTTPTPEALLPQGTQTPSAELTPASAPQQAKLEYANVKIGSYGKPYPEVIPPLPGFDECLRITGAVIEKDDKGNDVVKEIAGTAFGSTKMLNGDPWNDIRESHIFNPDGTLKGIIRPDEWSKLSQEEKDALDEFYLSTQPGSLACGKYGDTQNNQPQSSNDPPAMSEATVTPTGTPTAKPTMAIGLPFQYSVDKKSCRSVTSGLSEEEGTKLIGTLYKTMGWNIFSDSDEAWAALVDPNGEVISPIYGPKKLAGSTLKNIYTRASDNPGSRFCQINTRPLPTPTPLSYKGTGKYAAAPNNININSSKPVFIRSNKRM